MKLARRCNLQAVAYKLEVGRKLRMEIPVQIGQGG
jgi:hypothetical protein